MKTKLICVNIMCSVYVFGNATEECPDCGAPGLAMSSTQEAEFINLYRKVMG